MKNENPSDGDLQRTGEELMAGLRSDLGVKSDKELWEKAVRDVLIEDGWARRLLGFMNLTFMDAGDLGIGVTEFADSSDPGSIFFARSVFLTRFKKEGLGDLARWWMTHPNRRRRPDGGEGLGHFVFADSKEEA